MSPSLLITFIYSALDPGTFPGETALKTILPLFSLYISIFSFELAGIFLIARWIFATCDLLNSFL